MTQEEFLNQYDNYLLKHRDRISAELKHRYIDFQSNFSTSCLSGTELSVKIAFPSFIIWALYIIFFSHTAHWLISTIMCFAFLGSGIWCFILTSRIEESICLHFFEKYEYKNIIIQHLTKSRCQAIEQASSETEISSIEFFFSRCPDYIFNEFFEYY